MPLIIGVTGSIATGKSTACRYFVEQGAIHCDADKLVHSMYEPGKPAFDRIVKTFGNEVIGKDGHVNRKILGSKVFGKPEEMSKLTDAIGDIQAEVRGVMENWTHNNGNEETLIEDIQNEMSRITNLWLTSNLPKSVYMDWWIKQEAI